MGPTGLAIDSSSSVEQWEGYAQLSLGSTAHGRTGNLFPGNSNGVEQRKVPAVHA